MKLPVLDTYAFPVTLPSTGKTINMRPFLVREEKLLLMARESDNYQDQIEAVAQVILNCTNGGVDPKTAPYFDIEYLLLQIRARSVGETVTPIYKCHNIPNGHATECGHENTVKIDISKVPVSGLPQSPEKFNIRLSEDYTLHLRYPTIYTIHELVHATLNIEGKFKSQSYIEALCDIFDTLTHTPTNTVYNFSEYMTDEKIAFAESLSPRAFDEITDFLLDIPSVSTTIQFTCEACKFEHAIPILGINSFLD